MSKAEEENTLQALKKIWKKPLDRSPLRIADTGSCEPVCGDSAHFGRKCNLSCLLYTADGSFLYPPRYTPKLEPVCGQVKISICEADKGRCQDIMPPCYVLMYVFMGGAVMHMFALAFHVIDVHDLYEQTHIFFCSIGAMILAPLGIMAWVHLDGPGSTMLQEERRRNHIVLQAAGFIMNLIGVIVILVYTEFVPSESLHGILGTLSLPFLFLVVVLRLWIWCNKGENRLLKLTRLLIFLHKVFGLLYYILLAACFFALYQHKIYNDRNQITKAPTTIYLYMGLFIFQFVFVLLYALSRVWVSKHELEIW